jgi:histidyl-tRNA synthetase
LNDKKELTRILRGKLQGSLAELCDDCKARFEQNVLRILDCKNEHCREIIAGLGLGHEHLCRDCRSHFEKVKQGLGDLKIDHEATPYLVRGLDYYTRTVFEISHSSLGSQDALGAGGRYDNLTKELGGPDTPAIGFALGVERVLLARSKQAAVKKQGLVYLIALGQEARGQSLKLLDQLRQAGIPADTDYENKSLKGALRSANDAGARYAVIIGENELKNNTVTLKDMEKSEQREIKTEDLPKELKV